MSEREAINDLNYLCKGITNLNTLESITLGIKALEKHIPKKPNYKIEYHMHFCPNCDYPLPLSFNFCNHCGQALDRSDSE